MPRLDPSLFEDYAPGVNNCSVSWNSETLKNSNAFDWDRSKQVYAANENFVLSRQAQLFSPGIRPPDFTNFYIEEVYRLQHENHLAAQSMNPARPFVLNHLKECLTAQEALPMICENCSKEIEEGEEIDLGGDMYCQSCAEEHFVCAGCNDVSSNDNGGCIYDNETYCDSCTNVCYECSESFPSSAMEDIRVYGRSRAVCSSCLRSEYSECDECGSTYAESNGPCCEPEDRDSIDGDLSTIQESDYVRDTVFMGGTSEFPFSFGVEWELATSDSNGVIGQIRRAHDELFFGKCDGSVSGVELVSYPATLEFWERLNLSVPSGVSAPNSCGIHIHVCRRGFSSSQIKRIIRFFWEHKSFVKVISEREGNQLEQGGFGEIRKESDYQNQNDFKDGRDRCKYTAINLCHKQTIEFRIFASTLDPSRFLKNLEFIAALWLCSQDSDITLRRLKNTVKDNFTSFPNLAAFCELTNAFEKGTN